MVGLKLFITPKGTERLFGENYSGHLKGIMNKEKKIHEEIIREYIKNKNKWTWPGRSLLHN